MKRTVFTCACESIEHSLIVSSDQDYIYLEVHLATLPFWQRVKHAVRYIFGAKTKWGDFEEILLTPYEALSLGYELTECSRGDDSVFTPNDVY